MKIFENLKVFNESTQLLEYNRKDLRKWAGDDLTNRYMAIRGKVQAPENDLGYWIKKGDLEKFKDFVTGWETGEIKSKTQKKKEERIDGAELITEDKGWKVYFVTSYPAAKQLGSGTTWCITGRYHGAESKGEFYFKSYIKDYNLKGGYYFIFDTTKIDPASNDYVKYCAGVNRNNKLVFLYNGLQDDNITRKGIPVESQERAINLVPGVDIPFDIIFDIKDGVLVKVGDLPSGKIDIPNGVTSIGRKCFVNNRPLSAITFPDSLVEIGSGAFMNTRIYKVDLNKVEKLGRGAFYNCHNLTEANMGRVTEVPDNTFGYCAQLERVFFNETVTRISDNAFDECNPKLKIYGLMANDYLLEFAKKNGFMYLSTETGEIIYRQNKNNSEVEIDG